MPRKTKTDDNTVIEQFSQIRSKYKARADSFSSAPTSPIISDRHGFSLSPGPWLSEHYAGFDKLFHTLINNIVDDPDYALRKDPKVYQRMLRDPQIYYCLEVRKTATSSLSWGISPPEAYAEDPKAQQLAAAAQKRIQLMPQFDEFLSNILDALLPGLSINELIWGLSEGAKEYVVTRHFPKSKDRFKFNAQGKLYLLQPSAPTWGKPVPPYKFVAHTYNTTDGSWLRPEEMGYIFYGRGLADTPLYHYFYFKVATLRYLLKSLERSGNPFKIYYTGAQNAVLATKLDEMLTALQNDSVVGIPGKKGDTNVDVVSPRGQLKVFINFIEYIDKLITRAILGQELMTEMPSVGSYAAAQVHASVFARLAETDKNLTENTVNSTLMLYDAQLNTPTVPKEMRPVFKFKSGALVDIASFLDSVEAAQRIGLSISENQVRELTGLRKPQPGEQILGPVPLEGEEGDESRVNGEDSAGMINRLRKLKVLKGNGKDGEEKGNGRER